MQYRRENWESILISATLLVMATSCGFTQKASPFRMVKKSGNYKVPARWDQNYPLSEQNDHSWTLDQSLSENFNTSTIDESKWTLNNPDTWGWDPKNLIPTDSSLEFTLHKAVKPVGNHYYIGSQILSRKRALYGYFELEAQCSNDFANNNFYLYAKDPDQWTELDIFEVLPAKPGKERTLAMNAHVWKQPGVPQHIEFSDWFQLGSKFSDGYHVFGLKWTADTLAWYLDGHLVRQGTNTNWHQPLNISIGIWDSNQDDAISPSQLPSMMKVKYVRSWTQP